ncbi:hypothetical protein LTR46_002973 [Exophiala xenobiotica]|nr:hypothetical protein LTR46_002973 [Exophiala xenobiotica]
MASRSEVLESGEQLPANWDTLALVYGLNSFLRKEEVPGHSQRNERSPVRENVAGTAQKLLELLDINFSYDYVADILDNPTFSYHETAQSAFPKKLLTAHATRDLEKHHFLASISLRQLHLPSAKNLPRSSFITSHQTSDSHTEAASRCDRSKVRALHDLKPSYRTGVHPLIHTKAIRPTRSQILHTGASTYPATGVILGQPPSNPFAPETTTTGMADDTAKSEISGSRDNASVDEPIRRLGQLELESAHLRTELGLDAKADHGAEPKIQVFHCFQGHTYLDEPVCHDSPVGLSLRSVQPVNDKKAFFVTNSDIALAVFKEYRTTHARTADEILIDQSIQFVTTEMKAAVSNLVDMIPNRPVLFPDFDVDQKIEGPYLLVYSCYPIMTQLLSELEPQDQTLIRMLFDVGLENFGDLYQLAEEHKKRRVVSVKSLSFIFQPGDVLASTEGRFLQGYMMSSWPLLLKKSRLSEGRHHGREDDKQPVVHQHEWEVETWAWTYDGVSNRTEGATIIALQSVDDDEEIKLDSLVSCPLRYAADAVRSTLETRGRTFQRFEDKVFVSYQEEDDLGFSNIDERYMIDMATYKRLHQDDESRIPTNSSRSPGQTYPESASDQSVYLYPPTVIGYSMCLKKWVNLHVNRISDVKWNDLVFSHLVIDPESKELMQALVGSKLAVEKGTDVIVGKGNGLVVLLHGPPGTGKTFTAEGVAEFARKPLYRVTCGDIGTTPEGVEKSLQSILHLGKIWDCVVLLDEADVFLEERGDGELQRNALASVFLRCLDYYDGILILTSSRVGTFDEAFKSRVQLSLHYEKVKGPQRRKIWQNFINRVREIDSANVDADEILDNIEELSGHPMNGREIRNSITTAMQLAQYKGQTFGFTHLKHVINVAQGFDKYLTALREGISDDDIKRGQGLR